MTKAQWSERPGRPTVYPWHEMRIGDHFTLPYKKRAASAYVCGMNKKFRDAARLDGVTQVRKFQITSFDDLNESAQVRRIA